MKAATISTIRRHVDELNVEYKLYAVSPAREGPYRIRVRDLDAGENVSITTYHDLDQAIAKFAEILKGD